MRASRRSGREEHQLGGRLARSAFTRWPAQFKAGTVLNGIVSMQDWLPTLLAAAGEPDINTKLLSGYKADGKTFKVHIDGFNMLPYLTAR